jgi:hypothetical protein
MMPLSQLETRLTALERYNAFREVMLEYNLPMNLPLHCLHSDQLLETGISCIVLECWRKQSSKEMASLL